MWGEGGHIKRNHQHHKCGSTWASFHFCHAAEHLASTLILSHLLLLQLEKKHPLLPRPRVTDSITFLHLTPNTFSSLSRERTDLCTLAAAGAHLYKRGRVQLQVSFRTPLYLSLKRSVLLSALTECVWSCRERCARPL